MEQTVMTGDVGGKEAIPAITRMLTYTSRVGITIAEQGTSTSGSTEVEGYLKKIQPPEHKSQYDPPRHDE